MTRTNIPRLYISEPLSLQYNVTIEGAQAHYLIHVMRLREGEHLRLFNGTHGEWLARVNMISKKTLQAQLENQIRMQSAAPDVWLVFAPIKTAHHEFLVQKATELGASRLLPVRTDRTNVTRLSCDKMRLHAVEAAEQSERLDVPAINEWVPLSQLLVNWDANRPLFYGDESGNGANANLLLAGKTPPLALLIGPEGGFSEREFELLRATPFAHALSLGERILRADTAALAGLTLIQHYCN